MTSPIRGTVKCHSDDDVVREQQTLTDKARRKKRSGTFVPAFTIAFFRGIGLKPTATSHGCGPSYRVPRRGRLHEQPQPMHDTHATIDDRRVEQRRLLTSTPVSSGVSARRYLRRSMYNVHYNVQCTLGEPYTLVLSEEVAA